MKLERLLQIGALTLAMLTNSNYADGKVTPITRDNGTIIKIYDDQDPEGELYPIIFCDVHRQYHHDTNRRKVELQFQAKSGRIVDYLPQLEINQENFNFIIPPPVIQENPPIIIQETPQIIIQEPIINPFPIIPYNPYWSSPRQGFIPYNYNYYGPSRQGFSPNNYYNRSPQHHNNFNRAPPVQQFNHNNFNRQHQSPSHNNSFNRAPQHNNSFNRAPQHNNSNSYRPSPHNNSSRASPQHNRPSMNSHPSHR